MGKYHEGNTDNFSLQTNWSSAGSGMVRCSTNPQDNIRIQSKVARKRFLTKEQTKPIDVKLHTEQRAVQRAGFNYLVASKLSHIEQQRQQEEKLQKMIEEEEIRMMRKEMIPRAQLMPFFDRPFFPQRSTRPLTVPREPSLHIYSSKCWRCNSCCERLYTFYKPSIKKTYSITKQKTSKEEFVI